MHESDTEHDRGIERMSLPRYLEYKESGVEWLGEVPGHWDVKRFKQVFKERDERSDDGLETLLSVSAYTGVSPRSELIEKGEHLSRADSLEGYKICHPNDLVMNIMLAWNRGLAFSDYEGIVSPAYSVFQVIDGSFPTFLNYLVRTDLYTLYFKGFSSGVIDSRLRLYPDVFGRLSCGLPSLEEQQAIAAFLDRETGKIDALIAEQQQLVELLAEKRQAVISHAVTKGVNPNAKMKDSGIDWLGEVPEHWATPSLYMRYSSELGKMLDSSKITGDHLIPYVRNVDVQWGSINLDDLPLMDIREDEHQRYTIKAGDLLICEGGEVGRAAIVPTMVGVFGYQKALHRLRPINNDEDTKFMYFTLLWAANTGVFNLSGSSTIAHLTGEQLRKYRFPKPPFTEQQSIAAFLDTETAKFDTLTAEANRAIALLQERRSALISAAVTGKIDVRALSPSPSPILCEGNV